MSRIFHLELRKSNLEKLDKVARLLEDEPAQYSKILKEQLKLGLSFPEARAKAVSNFLNNVNFETKCLRDPIIF